MVTKLSHRERVRRALNQTEPDRVPLDLGGRVTSIHCEEYQKLTGRLGINTTVQLDPFYSVMNPDFRVLERLGVDFYYLFLKGPEYIVAKENPNGTYDNQWGITVKKMGTHSQRVTHPLEDADLNDLDSFAWPAPNQPERTTGLRDKARELYEDTDYALVAAPVNGGIFEFGQHLRGMSNFLIDLLVNKDFANALLDRLLEVQIGLWEVFIDAVGDFVEIAQLADDFGAQDNMLISPDLFLIIISAAFSPLSSLKVSKLTFLRTSYSLLPPITSLLYSAHTVLVATAFFKTKLKISDKGIILLKPTPSFKT